MSHQQNGYWGPVTANIDWCEPNYVGPIPWIAESWNTWSNIVYCVLAIHLISREFQYRVVNWKTFLCFLSLLSVGIGSFAFHATLVRSAQLMDELPMIYGTALFLFTILTSPERGMSPSARTIRDLAWGGFLLLYSVVLTFCMHWMPKYYLVFMIGYPLEMAATLFCSVDLLRKVYRVQSEMDAKKQLARRLLVFAVASFSFGFALWVVDNKMCDVVESFKLHSWWHLFSGLGIYFWGVAIRFMGMLVNHRQVQIRYTFGVLPFVVELNRQQNADNKGE